MKYVLSCLIIIWIAGSASPAITSQERPDGNFVRTHRIISQYGDIIANAADAFDIPHQILVGVILVESDGNARATTQVSSAKGLMQTIDATFEEAYTSLTAAGYTLESNPFNPESSIMAGAWYLDKMYNRAVTENQVPNGKRHSLASWQIPLTYYYAGPKNGAKQDNFIRVCSRGNCRIIDKNKYSSKVLTLATRFYPKPLRMQNPQPLIKTPSQPARKPAPKKLLFPAFSQSGTGFIQAADKGFD